MSSIKLSDLMEVEGIGEKTIERIKEHFKEDDEEEEFEGELSDKEIDDYEEYEGEIDINELYNVDCVLAMRAMQEQNIKVDSVVTDPPYYLSDKNIVDIKKLMIKYDKKIKKKGFMNKEWDGGEIEVVERDSVPKELLE